MNHVSFTVIVRRVLWLGIIGGFACLTPGAGVSADKDASKPKDKETPDGEVRRFEVKYIGEVNCVVFSRPLCPHRRQGQQGNSLGDWHGEVAPHLRGPQR
jgi:hypothetical protein